ncbi:MAG: hypothetical protein AAB371_03315 [Patescibacteria group bacterium]
MQEFIFYFSPILALLIFTGIAVFIKIRGGKVKLMGYDYLWFNNFQSKFRAKFRRLKLGEKALKFEKLMYNVFEKFIRKTKIESLKVQVWADKVLEKLKDKKNGSV